MRGVAGREKRYVGVVASFSTGGVATPIEVVWDDGRRFEVAKVLDRRMARSMRTGGMGMRYTVRIGATDTYLWQEGERWFVEAKVVDLP